MLQHICVLIEWYSREGEIEWNTEREKLLEQHPSVCEKREAGFRSEHWPSLHPLVPGNYLEGGGSVYESSRCWSVKQRSFDSFHFSKWKSNQYQHRIRGRKYFRFKKRKEGMKQPRRNGRLDGPQNYTKIARQH